MRSWRWLRVPAIILGAALAVGIVVQIVVGLTQRSWTDAYKYGRVEVPGKAILHLPAGSLDISLRELTVGTAHVPPSLRVSVVPLEGAPVHVTRAVGGAFGPSSGNVSYRRVFKASIPRAGAYRVTSAGAPNDANYAVELGHAPAAIGGLIWAYTGIAALAALLAWLIGRATGLIRAPASSPAEPRLSRTSSPTSLPAPPSADLDRLKELADLRDRGALTEAEFQAEKAKVLGL